LTLKEYHEKIGEMIDKYGDLNCIVSTDISNMYFNFDSIPEPGFAESLEKYYINFIDEGYIKKYTNKKINCVKIN
jgi:hypothetical protein